MNILMKKVAGISLLLTFVLIGATGSAVAEEPQSCACDGKLTTLLLRYIGDEETSVTVIQHNGDVIHEDSSLLPSEVFALTGTDQRGKKLSNTTLGPKINLFLGDGTAVEIHTSCSIEINAGDEFGDFRVLSGTSRHNGLICGEVEEPPCDPDVMECPGGPGGDG